MLTALLALQELERIDEIRTALRAVEQARLTALGQATNGITILDRISRGIRQRMKLSSLLVNEERRQEEAEDLARLRKAERVARRMQRKG